MENSKFNIVVTTAIYSHYIGQYNYLEILTTAIWNIIMVSHINFNNKVQYNKKKFDIKKYVNTEKKSQNTQ